VTSARHLSIGYGICLLALCGINHWQTDPEADPSTRRDSQGPSKSEIKGGVEIDVQLASMVHMIKERQSIAEELIAGNVTLDDAIDRFCELENDTPGVNHSALLSLYPGLSQWDRCCLQVIETAINLGAESQPGKAALTPNPPSYPPSWRGLRY
jgi:hypothetical protein